MVTSVQCPSKQGRCVSEAAKTFLASCATFYAWDAASQSKNKWCRVDTGSREVASACEQSSVQGMLLGQEPITSNWEKTLET